MLGQGRGERVALVDRVLDLGEDGAEGAVAGLFDQAGERRHERDAGAEQGGQLTGGHVHLLRPDPLANLQGEQGGPDAGGLAGRGLADFHRVVALAADLLTGGGRRVGVDDPFEFPARAGQGGEFVDWHGESVRGDGSKGKRQGIRCTCPVECVL